jgi:hypothetical protein
MLSVPRLYREDEREKSSSRQRECYTRTMTVKAQLQQQQQQQRLVVSLKRLGAKTDWLAVNRQS